tara:strand:- start:869 stop:1330 length:462 start_codon:yes stop_codon:yes gene_type:complete
MNFDDYIIFTSKIGNILIATHNERITKTYITNDTIKYSKNDILKKAKSQIIEYLEFKRIKFSIKISANGSKFQQKVWKEITNIPHGCTNTYLDIAKKLKTSPRAIGRACGMNPILIFIPCHRVISISNKLIGFSAIGGIKTKKKLLNIEKIKI